MSSCRILYNDYMGKDKEDGGGDGCLAVIVFVILGITIIGISSRVDDLEKKVAEIEKSSKPTPNSE